MLYKVYDLLEELIVFLISVSLFMHSINLVVQCLVYNFNDIDYNGYSYKMFYVRNTIIIIAKISNRLSCLILDCYSYSHN